MENNEYEIFDISISVWSAYYGESCDCYTPFHGHLNKLM